MDALRGEPGQSRANHWTMTIAISTTVTSAKETIRRRICSSFVCRSDRHRVREVNQLDCRSRFGFRPARTFQPCTAARTNPILIWISLFTVRLTSANEPRALTSHRAPASFACQPAYDALPARATAHIRLPAAERCLLCFFSSNVTVSGQVDADPDIDLRIRCARYSRFRNEKSARSFTHQTVIMRSTSTESCATSLGVIHFEESHLRSSSDTPRARPHAPHV